MIKKPFKQQNNFRRRNLNFLSKEEQKKCEGEITVRECLESLKSMEHNKTPCSDELPVEFYKTFWSDINEPLVKVLNYSYNIGKLSVTRHNQTYPPKRY